MKRIYLICAIMLTVACPLPSQHVTFHMLNGASKSSEDGGITWVYSMPKTEVVNFIRMDGAVKTTCDNGNKWMFLSAKPAPGVSVPSNSESITADRKEHVSLIACLDGNLMIPDEPDGPPQNVHVADLQGRSVLIRDTSKCCG